MFFGEVSTGLVDPHPLGFRHLMSLGLDTHYSSLKLRLPVYEFTVRNTSARGSRPWVKAQPMVSYRFSNWETQVVIGDE